MCVLCVYVCAVCMHVCVCYMRTVCVLCVCSVIVGVLCMCSACVLYVSVHVCMLYVCVVYMYVMCVNVCVVCTHVFYQISTVNIYYSYYKAEPLPPRLSTLSVVLACRVSNLNLWYKQRSRGWHSETAARPLLSPRFSVVRPHVAITTKRRQC